jgi:naphtho-gamma-pyrone polyketide synthase
LSIIGEEAGINPSDLSPNDGFGDYGIDSLLSLTICGRLQEELGLDLPSSLFADYLTVKELSNFFQGSEGFLSSNESSTDDKDAQTPDQDSDFDQTSSGYETQATSVAESNDVIEMIRATIAQETGVAIADITMSQNFTELGVDSLLGLTIMGRLSETLEMEVPSSLFTENDTLDGVEAALGLKAKEPTGKIPVTGSPHTTRLAIDEPPYSSSILLQGSPKSATKILWLFPDGSGSATSYSALAKISSDVVVYVLNCPWMKTPQDMECGLEGLTAKYVREIRRRQPHGPYHFGGWSAGGICAYEAAQQLSRQGEEIARLILIDSPNPIGLENPPQRMYDFFESLNFFGMNGKAPPRWLRPHFNAFIGLLDDYEIQPFSSRPLNTHIVYARDGICKHPSDPRPDIHPDDPREMIWLLNNRTDFSGSGWAQLVGAANLKISVLDDVNHFSMVAPGPKMNELCAFISGAMELHDV